MPEITVLPENKRIPCTEGKSVLDCLVENGVFIDNPCNGKGTCGKCKVRIVEGDFSEAKETEKKLLGEKDIKDGIRLACQLYLQNDAVIEVIHKEKEHKVLTGGYIPDFEFAPAVKKQVVDIVKPDLDTQTSFEEQILNATRADRISLDTLRSSVFEEGSITAVTFADEVISIEKGDTTEKLYGVAIDIGTTTVVCSLVDINTGEEIANASMINAQKHFGLDVLTRITYETEHPYEGARNLQNAIVNSINDMIFELCVKAGIYKTDIYEIVVAANCTMMHMLLGVDATSIGTSPYAPVFTRALSLKTYDIGIDIAREGRIYCIPSVSSYIGADIVAGAYVSGLNKEKGNVLFIDIGTNGEIVLCAGEKLISCSCAAGPALEGMNISCGMRAADGAIEDIRITEDGVEIEIIGNGSVPEGLCGSGILAAVRELVRSGLIKKSGVFVKTDSLDKEDHLYPLIKENGRKREFAITELNKALVVTQADIRQVQLAKGAILSGFIALLNKMNITMEMLDKVIIAGQFGSHITADSLTGTGILPKEVEDKISYIGNSSKTGAYMALMSRNVRKELEQLAENMEYMELSAVDGYEKLFSDCLMFPNIEKE